MAEKDLDTVTRRVTSLTNHLISSRLVPSQYQAGEVVGLCLCNTSSSSMNDSYQRVHGDVPSHDVVWRIACDDSGKEFTDIVYEKADGEAIAKVEFFIIFF